jgi:hypothetical protein
VNLGIQNRAVKTAGSVALIASAAYFMKREIPIPDPFFWAAMGAMFAASIVLLFERFRWGWFYLGMSLWGMYSPPETHPMSRTGVIVCLALAVPALAIAGRNLARNVRERRTA